MSIFNNVRLLMLLPQIFKTGSLILKSLEGGLTKEELEKIIDEVRETVKSVPELAAFLGLFDSLVKVAVTVLPVILGDKGQMFALNLKEEQVNEALAVARLMQPVIEETVIKAHEAADKVKDEDIEGML